jgi:hypothetical protein
VPLLKAVNIKRLAERSFLGILPNVLPPLATFIVVLILIILADPCCIIVDAGPPWAAGLEAPPDRKSVV